jgi:arylsulfatase A-like enzyme
MQFLKGTKNRVFCFQILSMKHSLFFAGLGSLPIILLPGCQTNHQIPPPNIIFILADDLGYGDLSCLNPESRIRTPIIDRFASEGCVLTNAHSPSSVSSPTRYGILTGEYCFRSPLKSGVLTGYSPALIKSETLTVAELLQNHAYHTACIGKWHLGLNWAPRDSSQPLYSGDPWAPTSTNIDYSRPVSGGPDSHGFDYSFIIPASLDMVPYCFLQNGKAIAPVTQTIKGNNEPRGVFWRSGEIQDNFRLNQVLPTLTTEAINYIESRSATGQPFFLYLPLTAPHTPWLPDSSFVNQSGAGTYGDFVVQIDHCIGTILEAVMKGKIEQNTLIIITSDNGSNWTTNDILKWQHRSNGIFRGQKSDVWEGGHHVPFLTRWPAKINAGSKSDQLICLTDLLATVAQLTGHQTTKNEGPDSYSFLDALSGKKPGKHSRNSVIHHSISGMFAITAGNWKLIDGRGSGGWSDAGNPNDPPRQLYNLQKDPKETDNLIFSNPIIADSLTRMLEAAKKSPI